MIDFIIKYWLQAFFGIVLTVLVTALKKAFAIISEEKKLRLENAKKESKEQDLIKEALLCLMHDRIFQACRWHLGNGEIAISEMKNLKKLYDGYAALGGNGTAKELYERCQDLPIQLDSKK